MLKSMCALTHWLLEIEQKQTIWNHLCHFLTAVVANCNQTIQHIVCNIKTKLPFLSGSNIYGILVSGMRTKQKRLDFCFLTHECVKGNEQVIGDNGKFTCSLTSSLRCELFLVIPQTSA